MFNSR